MASLSLSQKKSYNKLIIVFVTYYLIVQLKCIRNAMYCITPYLKVASDKYFIINLRSQLPGLFL